MRAAAWNDRLRNEEQRFVPMTKDEWDAPVEFEPIAHANKPFSLRVPALVVTRAPDGTLNCMLAMWFMPMGVEPSSFLVAVERSTKTYALIMETGEFVIAAPDESLFDVALYAGAVSGYAEDKWSVLGLTPLQPKAVKVPLVREALANVELTVLRTMPYDRKYDLIVGEVKACHVKSEFFREGVYLEHANPLLWLGKASGVAAGDKTAAHYGAAMGRIFAADYGSPLLRRLKKR